MEIDPRWSQEFNQMGELFDECFKKVYDNVR